MTFVFQRTRRNRISESKLHLACPINSSPNSKRRELVGHEVYRTHLIARQEGGLCSRFVACLDRLLVRPQQSVVGVSQAQKPRRQIATFSYDIAVQIGKFVKSRNWNDAQVI